MVKRMLLAILFFSSSPSVASNYCQTHIACSVGQTCACDIIASAYDRFFYVNYERLQKGYLYFCRLVTPPFPTITSLPDSHIPDGATETSATGGFVVDTRQMAKTEETMIIKFFIPGSDYGARVEANCQLQSASLS